MRSYTKIWCEGLSCEGRVWVLCEVLYQDLSEYLTVGLVEGVVGGVVRGGRRGLAIQWNPLR